MCDDEDELRIRSEVRIITGDFEDKADTLVFDSSRDNQTSVNLKR